MSPVKSGSDAAKRSRYRANYTRARSGIWQGKACALMRGITGVPRVRAVFRRIGAVDVVRVTGDRGARRDGCGVGHTLFRRPADFCFPGVAGSGSACPISFLGSYDVQRRAISWRYLVGVYFPHLAVTPRKTMRTVTVVPVGDVGIVSFSQAANATTIAITPIRTFRESSRGSEAQPSRSRTGSGYRMLGADWSGSRYGPWSPAPDRATGARPRQSGC